jgi:hypothetical protein
MFVLRSDLSSFAGLCVCLRRSLGLGDGQKCTAKLSKVDVFSAHGAH